MSTVFSTVDCAEEGAVDEKYRQIEALHLTVFFDGP
jgi:hypothetical protein